jgi:hypothetical protein
MVMSYRESERGRKRMYWEQRKNVPDDALVLKLLPEPNDPWDYDESPVQAFALSMDGYESPCVEEAGLAVAALLERRCSTGLREIRTWPLGFTRTALFLVQRACHDACCEPSPVLIETLLRRVRELVAAAAPAGGSPLPTVRPRCKDSRT